MRSQKPLIVQNPVNGITHGGFYSYIILGIYHYALSNEMTLGALVFHGKCAWTHRMDGWMMYRDIDCEYTLTFQLHLI